MFALQRADANEIALGSDSSECERGWTEREFDGCIP